MLRIFKLFQNILKPAPRLHISYDSKTKRKPVIVLLHGIAATSKTWDVLIKDIDIKKYRVVALDLLGFGQSPKLQKCEYNIDDHVASIHRTIRKLHLKKPYIIMGHSMGAIVAARYAIYYPGDISKMYLLSPPIYLDNRVSQTGLSRKLTDIYLDAYRFLADKKDFTIVNSQFIRKLFKVQDGIDVNEKNWDSFRLSLINTVVKQDFYEDIRNSIHPISIIYGSLDQLLIPESINKLDEFDNVSITKLKLVDHIIGQKFASEIVKQLQEK